MKRLITIALLVMMTCGPAQASLQTWRATAPTEGSAAVLYQWEVQLDGASWVRLSQETVEPVISFDQVSNITYLVRIRAVDANGNVGDWAVSLPDVVSKPGACGVPERDK